jgi:hypothetical protein
VPDDLGPEEGHGGADEEFDFAGVVFDEDFVRSAAVHEPTAEERMLAAVEASFMERRDRALPEELRPPRAEGYGPSWTPNTGAYAGWQAGRRARPGTGGRHLAMHLRWEFRAMAWVLALIMGLGVVLLAAAAVYRGVSGSGASTRAPGQTATQGSGAPDKEHVQIVGG